MSSFAYGEELVEILSFIEVISLKDIKDYWKITDNIRLVEFTRFESVEIHYESDELRVSKENISNNFQSLEKAKEFIIFLIQNERLSRAVARKTVTINEFYAIFEPDDVLNILYRAEEYAKCIDYYTRHVSAFINLINAQLIYQKSLSKVGNYIEELTLTDENFNLALAIMRNLWQKGAFSSAKKITDRIDGKINELDPSQKCYFLNNKIRILRDMGSIRETDILLAQFNNLLVDISKSNLALYNDLKGKYLYNQSINCYINGEFGRCIAFCKQSLALRTDKYPDPYIRLREARCLIFQGNRKEYLALIKTIHIDQSDNWAQSLFLTVQSEYNRFILDNTGRAKQLLKQSNKVETLNGADTVYTDIALLYLYIQCNQKFDIIRYVPTINKYKEYIDGKLAAITAHIALDVLKGESVDERIIKLRSDYQDYPVYLFVSLFSLAKLFEKLDTPFPLSVEDLPFRNGFSKELLSAFSKKPRVLIIYSWWDEFGNEDTENKSWVSNLNVALRKHGISSYIDKTYALDNTIDSRKLVLSEDYDNYIVILNAGFKKRVEQKKGILYTEYEELLEVLKHSPQKIIFVAKGENDAISPDEIKYNPKLDLTSSNLQKKNDKRILGLVREIRNIPYYDTTIPLVDEDVRPEPISFE